MSTITSLEHRLLEVLMLLHTLNFYLVNLSLLIFPLSSMIAQSTYPSDFQEKYVRKCSEGHRSQTEVVCRCVVEQVQRKYSFNEFLQIDRQIESSGQIPSELREIINICRAYTYL